MELVLKRRYLGTEYTIGSLYIDGQYFCDTLEDAVRDKKVQDKTAIPYGTYVVRLSVSNRFKRALPLITYVNGFTGVRIHRGNTAEDTSGCILLGENKLKGKVTNSTKYEMKLVNLMLVEFESFRCSINLTIV